MKIVFMYLIYALTLLNLYVWMIWPAIFYAMFKWSIFMALLYAPLIYYTLREKKPQGRE